MSTRDIHEWLSFEYAGETYLFDLTFLGSSWSCIYGRGCPGIDEAPAPELSLGCCSHGAYFTDKADRKRTKQLIAMLGDDEWQYKPVAEELGGAIYKNEDGDWVTRVVDGACIMQNRAGFEGGPGCALHLAAVKRGERFIDWKPTVCWQAPLRLDYHVDDNDHLTKILREWKRRDWGEGGFDFHWWCTDDPLAFTAREPVYVTLRDEIIEMVGEEPYTRLAEHLEQQEDRLLPHPALKKRA
ncbi:hypothetical protein [Rhabdothermincola sp.]|uniref:hypothetical protein n=1 Tax=Rhabdothermincola sp. TaxID=2820405 RepID=UPI002FE0E87F